MKTTCKQVKGKSALCRLPYFDMIEDTPLDMMHIVSGVMDRHLMSLTKGARVSDALKTASKSSPSSSAKRPRTDAMEDAPASDVDSDSEERKSTDHRASSAAAAAPRRPIPPAPVFARLTYPVTMTRILELINFPAKRNTMNRYEAEALDKHQRSSDELRAPRELPAPGNPTRDENGIFVYNIRMLEEESAYRESHPVTVAADLAAAAPASSSAASPEVDRLAEHQRRFPLLSQSALAELDLIYLSIEAPLNIAPASKRPYTQKGSMTAHHWVNFTKCYGKYLLLRQFQSPAQRATLKMMCNMLDFVALCLSSSVSRDTKVRIAQLRDTVARTFEQDWPEIEHAVIMHLLIFHIPDTIARWGPVRGYWCFPFERMIGKLANSIKNRRYPEVNLVNRYLSSVATWRSQSTAVDEAYHHSHPLVISETAVNSQLQADTIFWPAPTANNRRRSPLDSMKSHARERILIPILGESVCEPFKGCSNDFTLWDYRIALQKGRWKYNTSERELKEQGHIKNSSSCWFRIRAKHVPHWNATALEQHAVRVLLQRSSEVDLRPPSLQTLRRPHRRVANWNDDEFIYGRIMHFELLLLPAWNCAFQLAKVNLFWPSRFHPITQLPVIDLSLDELHFAPDGGRALRPIQHVQVQHIDAPIGRGPVEGKEEPHSWYVLPVDSA